MIRRWLYFKNFFCRVLQKFFGYTYNFSRINGKRIMDGDEANKYIYDKLREGKPFSVVRPGNAEYSFAADWNEHELYKTKRYVRQVTYKGMQDDRMAERWVHDVDNALGTADIVAVFNSDSYMLKYILEAYGKNEAYMWMKDIEGLWSDNPWTIGLEGKKVLFVSPFAKTMEMQYQRIDKVWPEKKVLPKMDAMFVESVWFTAGDSGEFSTWYEALDCLYERICGYNFDVAVMGCGPFAIHLCDLLKKNNKTAIQVGGALQLLFGIRGARWDVDEHYSSLCNEYWVRPSKDNAPTDSFKLDGGCYW